MKILTPFIGRGSIQAAVDALTVLDVAYLRAYPDTPPLYRSGVRYEQEPRNVFGAREEDFLTIPYMLARGVADCEDMSAARSAELIVRGIQARPVVMPVSGGYHVIVRLPNGRVEDPSARLGMRF